MNERQLPHSIDAEEGVLGSLIIDPMAFDLVSDTLHADDFYREAHRLIYDAMTALAGRRVLADSITLCDELDRSGQLANVGGPAAIVSLVNRVPTSGNVEYYADIVTRAALMRRLAHAGSQITTLAYNQDDNAVETAERLLFDAQRSTGNKDFATASDVVDACLMDLDELHRGDRSLVGVPSGFAGVDYYTGGMQRSDLIIVAGRPGMGKSAYMLSMAYHAAIKRGFRVAVFSLEMSRKQLMQRLLSYDSHVDLYRLRNGDIRDHEWNRLMAAREFLATDRLMIDDTAGITLSALRAKARRLQAAGGLDLIIVDYLQLMHADAGQRDRNREREVAELSGGLKELAKELDIPVVALAQLSRAVESRGEKRPQLSDLRESGAIENDADVIEFLYRDEYYNPDTAVKGHAEVIIAKHRNGPVGNVDLHFIAAETRFTDHRAGVQV